MAAVIALSLQNKVSKTLKRPQKVVLKVTLNSAGRSFLCLFAGSLEKFFGFSCSHIVFIVFFLDCGERKPEPKC